MCCTLNQSEVVNTQCFLVINTQCFLVVNDKLQFVEQTFKKLGSDRFLNYLYIKAKK